MSVAGSFCGRRGSHSSLSRRPTTTTRYDMHMASKGGARGNVVYLAAFSSAAQHFFFYFLLHMTPTDGRLYVLWWPNKCIQSIDLCKVRKSKFPSLWPRLFRWSLVCSCKEWLVRNFLALGLVFDRILSGYSFKCQTLRCIWMLGLC